MFSVIIIFINYSLIYYISINTKYLVYKLDKLLLYSDLYTELFWLLIVNCIVLYIQKFIVTTNYFQSKFSKYLVPEADFNILVHLFLLIIFISIISLIYFFILLNICLRIFLFESHLIAGIIPLDGVIDIGLNYKLERFYTSTEKLNFGYSVINNNILSLNDKYQTSITLNITSTIQEKILSFKTFKEIENYCLLISNKLYFQEFNIYPGKVSFVSKLYKYGTIFHILSQHFLPVDIVYSIYCYIRNLLNLSL